MVDELIKRPWLKRYDAGVPYHIDYPAITVFDMLEDASRKYPDRRCLILDDAVMTYAQVHTITDRLSAGLRQIGVRKGDRVGLMMPNVPQFILTFFAILKAGGIVVALNPLYKPGEVAQQLKDVGVKVLVAMDQLLPVIRQAVPGTPLRWIILTEPKDAYPDTMLKTMQEDSARTSFAGNRAGDGLPGLLRFSDLPSLQISGRSEPVAITPDDEAIFQFSGGTTGVSKAAIGLHRNLVANAIQFRHWLVGAEDGQEIMLLAIPLYHVYGMVVGMLVAVRLGASMVLVPNPRDLNYLLLKLQEHRASLFPGVPNLYQAIINHSRVSAGEFDLSSIKACISGSAPLLRETKERFETLTGGKLLEGYGLSEAPTATHCNPMLGENRTGSIGLPLPDVDSRIVSLEDGETDLPVGEAGELILKGPQVMKGYFNMPEETALALRGGWLYTGDIARMDADGFFYLVDRKKDVMKPGGFQVWPREVEEVLVKHPKVLEAGVAGVMDPARGEVVKAWVVLRPEFRIPEGFTPDQAQAAYDSIEDELRQFCRQQLAAFKVPSMFEFRDGLPRTGVGKLLRRELVRQHYASAK